MYKKQLLINPPISKPSEPPIALAALAGSLKYFNITFEILDLNIEMFFEVLEKEIHSTDKFSERSLRNVKRNINILHSVEGYYNLDKYKKTMYELNKKLSLSFDSKRFNVSFADFEDLEISPMDTKNLERIFRNPSLNPFYSFFTKLIERSIDSIHPNIVGISINYLSQALTGFSIAGFIRLNFPELEIVIGGGLCSSWMQTENFEKLCKTLKIRVVKGPGENVLPLLSGVEQGLLKSHYCPDFSQFKNQKYFAPCIVLPFMAERGCYYGKCRFCPERAEGNVFKPKSSKRIIDDITSQIEISKAEIVHFLDNAMSPKILKEITLNSFGKPWYGFARVTRELEEIEFCEKLKNSGCVMLQLGIESGSDMVLSGMEKGTNVKSISKVLKNLKKVGIGVFAYFLFGTIWENENEALNTINFILDHSSYIDYLNMAVFNLPINSPDSKEIEKYEFYYGDLSLYENFKHPFEWDRRKVRDFLSKKIKENKEISTIVNRTPPFFTSNHAPFFLINKKISS